MLTIVFALREVDLPNDAFLVVMHHHVKCLAGSQRLDDEGEWLIALHLRKGVDMIDRDWNVLSALHLAIEIHVASETFVAEVVLDLKVDYLIS